MDYKIELLARAFYDAEHDECLWDYEAEPIKEVFRGYARDAIGLLNSQTGQSLQPMTSMGEQMISMKGLEIALVTYQGGIHLVDEFRPDAIQKSKDSMVGTHRAFPTKPYSSELH